MEAFTGPCGQKHLVKTEEGTIKTLTKTPRLGWSYLCHLMINVESGITGQLVHILFQQRPISENHASVGRAARLRSGRGPEESAPKSLSHRKTQLFGGLLEFQTFFWRVFIFILGGFKETDVYFSDDTQTDINKQLNEINMACQMECFTDLLDFFLCFVNHVFIWERAQTNTKHLER